MVSLLFDFPSASPPAKSPSPRVTGSLIRPVPTPGSNLLRAQLAEPAHQARHQPLDILTHKGPHEFVNLVRVAVEQLEPFEVEDQTVPVESGSVDHKFGDGR